MHLRSISRGCCGSWREEGILLMCHCCTAWMVGRLCGKLGLLGSIYLYQMHLLLEDFHQGPLTCCQGDELTFQQTLPKVVSNTPAQRIKQYCSYCLCKGGDFLIWILSKKGI